MFNWVLFVVLVTSLLMCGLTWLVAAGLSLVVTWATLAALRRAAGVRPISGIAQAFYKNDADRTMVVSNITVVARLTREAVMKVIEKQYLGNKLYHQRVQYSHLLGYHWQDCELQLHDHIFFDTTLRSEADLRVEFARLLQRPVDWHKPLWSIHVFLNVQGDRSALIFRLHHMLGDGVSLLRQWLEPVQIDAPVTKALTGAAGAGAAAAAEMAGGAAAPSPAAARAHRPRSTAKPSMAAALCRTVSKTPVAMRKALFSDCDPESPLKRHAWITPQTTRRCDWWTTDCSIDDIKAASGAVQGNYTVNDILMAALAEAVTSCFPPAAFPIDPKVVMWVSLTPLDSVTRPLRRPADLFDTRGLSFVYYDLPCRGKPSSNSPAWALQTTKERVAELIGSPEPAINNIIFRVLGHLPAWLLSYVWKQRAFVSTISCSNMRTPAGALSWGNAAIYDVSFGVPVHGSIGIFCCIFSFNNRITFSVNCDPSLIPQEKLHNFVHKDFNDALSRIVQHLKGGG